MLTRVEGKPTETSATFLALQSEEGSFLGLEMFSAFFSEGGVAREVHSSCLFFGQAKKGR